MVIQSYGLKWLQSAFNRDRTHSLSSSMQSLLPAGLFLDVKEKIIALKTDIDLWRIIHLDNALRNCMIWFLFWDCFLILFFWNGIEKL